MGDTAALVRLDLSGNNPQNTAGKFLVEVDTVNNANDTITAVRWNNIGCIWQMTNVNGTFQSGQSFRVLVNYNGVGQVNTVDTPGIYPLMQPTVPGPGLLWNLTGIQPFGTVGVTNCNMVWDGSGTGSWDTNGSTASASRRLGSCRFFAFIICSAFLLRTIRWQDLADKPPCHDHTRRFPYSWFDFGANASTWVCDAVPG
jgi:hypothetical protein